MRSFDDLATISQCPTFQAYQEGAEPAFQRLCMSCHASGRKGAGKLLLYQGGDDGGIVAAKNYFKAQAMAVVSADASGEIDITVELLAYLNGTRTHDLNIGIASSDYATIRNWVESELNEKCVIDQVTGTVSVVSP